MKKKIISILLVLILTIGTSQSVWAVETSTQTNSEYGMGWIPESEEDLESIPVVTADSARTIYTSVDLTNKFPTPGNQGTQGSCTAWAVGYALKSYQEQVERDWGLNTQSHLFSPAYIYNQINGGTDNGSGIISAMKLVVEQGACPLADMPYKQNDWNTLPNATQKSKAALYKATGYALVTSGDVAAMKSQLAKGLPVVIGINVYPDFVDISQNNQIYDNMNGISRGNHAICLIGYDDSKNAFKFINSWGTNWGLGGYGYISYDLIKQANVYGFVMHDIDIRDDVDAFVKRLYKEILGRNPDSTGLTQHTNSIITEKRTAATVIDAFIASSEYTSKKTTNEQFVDAAYKAILNRSPDGTGKQDMLKALDLGVSRKYVLNQIIKSTEFSNQCADIGMVRGSITLTEARDKNIKITEFVYYLYVNGLDRKPDTEGLNAYTNSLNNGGSAASVVRAIFTSTEYTNRKRSNSDFVEDLYKALLQRASDSVGKRDWVNKLNAGTSRLDVIKGFINSGEFTNICTKYGITKGS